MVSHRWLTAWTRPRRPPSCLFCSGGLLTRPPGVPWGRRHVGAVSGVARRSAWAGSLAGAASPRGSAAARSRAPEGIFPSWTMAIQDADEEEGDAPGVDPGAARGVDPGVAREVDPGAVPSFQGGSPFLLVLDLHRLRPCCCRMSHRMNEFAAQVSCQCFLFSSSVLAEKIPAGMIIIIYATLLDMCRAAQGCWIYVCENTVP